MAASIDSVARPQTGVPLMVRLAVCTWIAIALAVGARTLLEPSHHTIFPILSNSAAHWWNDQSLYADYKPLDFYRYSPSFAVAATPLWALGLRGGGIIWTWLNLGVYAAGLWRFRRDVLPGAWSKQQEALYFILAALGGLRGFWNAQSNALMIGLLLLGAAAVIREQWWRAALWLALPVLVKITPLSVVLLFCVLWPRHLPLRLFVVLSVGFLVPFVTKSPDAVLGYYAEWYHHLAGSSGERWLGFRDGWTFWLVVRHLVTGGEGEVPLRSPIDAPGYRVVQLATALAVLAWSLYLQRRGCDRRRLVNVTLGLGTAWLMVFGPASEHATYVFLAPSLAWALVDTRSWPRGRYLILSAGILILALGWGALARWTTADLLLAALPVGTLLFATWFVGYSLQDDVTYREPLAARSASDAFCRIIRPSRSGLVRA
jgi:hypothetical protein